MVQDADNAGFILVGAKHGVSIAEEREIDQPAG
jgi:hypothetical protein